MNAAYPVVAYDLDGAAAASGIGKRSLQVAIADGSLTAHYVGGKQGKPIIRAADLDDWVQSLPTERRAS